MKSSLFTVAIVALSLCLGACSVSKQDGVMSANERKGGFLGLSTRADVEVETPKAFANKQKVVIGGFKVGFNTSKKMANKAGSGFGGKSTALVKLEGVNSAVMQDVTNHAYADFVAELKSAGYTVVPRSQFTSSEHYEGTKTFTFPYTSDNSGFLSEYGTAEYFSPSAIGNTQPIWTGEIAGETGGWGHDNPANAAAEYGKTTGVAVLNVVYFVDFAASAGHGGGWSSTSSIKVGQMLAADQGRLGLTSDYGGTFSTGIGSLALGQPVASEKAFAQIEETSTGAEKGVETAANVFSAVLGGGTNQTRKFVYNANPAQYKAAALDVLNKANAAFSSKMAELR